MANVFNAAALAGVDRIIFASSNHVMGEYKESTAMTRSPWSFRPGRTVSMACFKLVGERLGQSIAQAFDLVFIALRIGWVQEGAQPPRDLP